MLHSSLLGPFVSYNDNEVLWMRCLNKLDGGLNEGPRGVAVVVPEGPTTLDPALGHVVGPASEELAGISS